MTTPGITTEADDDGRFPTRDELRYAAAKEAGFPGLGVPARSSRGVVTSLQAPFATEDTDTSAYVGTAQEYMTHAEVLNQPFKADGGVEQDLEERLTQQPTLVAPITEPEENQTEGGGSSQEVIYTALSGENFSSEVAKPLETETVEVPTPQTPGTTGQLEVGVSGGSTGEKIGDVEEQRLTEQAEKQGGSTPVQEAETGDASGTPASSQVGTPTPTKKTTTPKQS